MRTATTGRASVRDPAETHAAEARTTGQYPGSGPATDEDSSEAPPDAGRHKRDRRLALSLTALLSGLVLLATSSGLAYAAWGPGGAARQTAAECAPGGAGCGRKAPATSAGARARPTHPAAAAGASPKPVAAPTGFAPYVDVTYDPAVDLAGTLRTAGVKQFILGFVVAGGGCSPTWGGDVPIDDEEIRDRVRGYRAAGGKFSISFGGADGDELAKVCTSVTDLVAAYQHVIDTYSATSIDFDIEGDELGDNAGHTRRGQAIAILERNAAAAGRRLDVAMTLPVNPGGFTASPVRILNAVAEAHATVSVVNVMAMDFGSWAAPNPQGRMGTFAIQAITNAHATVRRIFGLSSAQAWRRMAVTPLIGVNSPATEVFTVRDAAKVMAFARTKNAAFVSMWAITRDRPCPAGVTADAEADTCAGNAPSQFAFTRAFLGG